MSEMMAMQQPSVGMSIYKWVVDLYPEVYRDEFGGQMLLGVEDLYQEELSRTGSVGLGFWLRQLEDASVGLVGQHIYVLGGKGMKKYLSEEFGLTGFHVAGIILLLPFLTMLTLGFLMRVVQGNLNHPNGTLLQSLQRTWLHNPQVLFVWVVLFPLLAVLLALLPVIMRAHNKTHWLSLGFLKANLVSTGIIVVGLGCVALIKFHDFVPCLAHGVLRQGFGNLPAWILVCWKA